MNSGEDYYALGSEVAEISSWRKKHTLSLTMVHTL